MEILLQNNLCRLHLTFSENHLRLTDHSNLMKNIIYHDLVQARQQHQKKFAVLIDPDKVSPESLMKIIDISVKASVEGLFVIFVAPDSSFGSCLEGLSRRCAVW